MTQHDPNEGTDRSADAPGLATLIVILVSLWSLLYLPLLGNSGLWDPWEPRYAQAPREMAERGDWIVPYYRGDARLVKPPLTYWMIGASQAVLGVTERAARTPSAILALLCPLALGWALWRRGLALEGLLAGAALLTGPQWLLSGRFATPDMPHASLLGLALACCVAAPAFDERWRRWWVMGAAVAVALATLTEWPRGLLLPAWAVLAWGACLGRARWIGILAATSGLYLAGQQLFRADLNLVALGIVLVAALAVLRTEARIPWLTLGMLVGLIGLLVAPWFIAVFNAEPAEAAGRLLGYKHGLNLGETPEQHTGPWFYSLLIVLIGALPWSATAAVGAFHRATRDGEVVNVLRGAALGGLLFFTLSEAKMGHFHVVLQAPIAGLAAVGIMRATRARNRSVWIVMALLALIAGWIVWRQTTLIETAQVKRSLHGLVELIPAVCLALAATAALLWVARWRQGWRMKIWITAPSMVLSGFLAFSVIPTLSPTKSLRRMWVEDHVDSDGNRQVRERMQGAPVAMYGSGKDSAYYYGNGRVWRLRTNEELREFMNRPGSKFTIMRRKTFDKLSPDLQEPWDVVPEIDHSSLVLLRYRQPPSTR